VRNQFGYSAGGPIQKNKTFFFANEEFERFSTTILKASIVPTAAFSYVVIQALSFDQRERRHPHAAGRRSAVSTSCLFFLVGWPVAVDNKPLAPPIDTLPSVKRTYIKMGVGGRWNQQKPLGRRVG